MSQRNMCKSASSSRPPPAHIVPLLLLLAARSPLPNAAAPPEEFVLGIYGPMTSIDLGFAAMAVAFELDFKKNYNASVAARFGPPVVSVPDLNPGLRFKVQIGDSSSDTEIGMRTGLNFLQGQNGVDPIQGLVGGYHSGISMPIASLATLFKLTQVSWGSTSPKLSNKATYPYFLRTIPPDSIQGGGLWSFIAHFEIPSVVLCYAREPYGEGLFSAVSEAANAVKQGFRILGVGVEYMPGDGAYDSAKAVAKLSLIQRLGSKVMFLCMARDQGKEFLPLAKEMGMLRNDRQLLGSEALPFNDFPELSSVVGYMWFSPVSKGSLWSTFEDTLWKALTTDDVLGAPAQALYKMSSWEVPISDARGGTLSPASFDSATNLIFEAPYVFDAAYAFVMAANEMMNEGTPLAGIKGAALLEKVKAVSFEGLSGTVAFNSVGDRSASYEIFNVQPGPVARIAAMYSAVTGQIAPVSGADFWWMTGTSGFAIPDPYVSCEPGFWKDSFGDNPTRMCYECGAGTISTGGTATQCEPCSAGYMASKARAATECLECEAGNYSAESKSTQCTQCEKGFFSETSRATVCAQCVVGTYAAQRSATECKSCGSGKKNPELYATQYKVEVMGVMEWNALPGATEESTCGCTTGAYEKNGECELCGTGMMCIGMGEVLLEQTYYSDRTDPGFVFHCSGGDQMRCPGGLPGTCAAGRVTTTVACTSCAEGMRPGEDGTCVECGDGSAAPLVVFVLVAVILMCVLYHVISTSKPNGRRKSFLLIGIAGSQTVTILQQLGVFGSVAVQWKAPFKDLLQFVSLFNFKLDYLSLECAVHLEPESNFAIRIFLVLGLFLFMVLIHVVSVVVLHRRQFQERMPALIGSVGTVFSAFFISIVSSMLAPFQCNDHPNLLKTVRDFPSVVCFDDLYNNKHSTMVAISLAASVIPLAFLAQVFLAVFNLPKNLSKGDTRFLQSFGFLFFRFRAGAHWYVVVFLLRNLVVSIIPAIGSPMFQILILQSITVALLVTVIHYLPWGVMMANILDAATSVFLVLLLIVFALSLKDTDDTFLARFGFALVMLAFISIICAMACGMYERYLRKGKPFQFVLCHHKGGAGNFTRLLKMFLVRATEPVPNVLVDSDGGHDVASILGCVGSDTDKLVVVCSREMLTSPWCMGEVSTARTFKVPIVKVFLPDFELPPCTFIDKYEELVPNATMLSPFGISLELVKDSMRWLLKETPTINFNLNINDSNMKGLVDLLVKSSTFAAPAGTVLNPAGGKVLPSVQSQSSNSLLVPSSYGAGARNVIVADLSTLEYACAAFVLQMLLKPLMKKTPADVPQVLPADAALTTRAFQLILVCTNGVFMCAPVVSALLCAAELGLAVLPLVVEPNFKFPTKDFLEELAVTSSDMLNSLGSPYSGSVFAHVVGCIFQETTMELNPQNAESVLDVRAQKVVDRLLGIVCPLGIDLAKKMDAEKNTKGGANAVAAEVVLDSDKCLADADATPKWV